GRVNGRPVPAGWYSQPIWKPALAGAAGAIGGMLIFDALFSPAFADPGYSAGYEQGFQDGLDFDPGADGGDVGGDFGDFGGDFGALPSGPVRLAAALGSGVGDPEVAAVSGGSGAAGADRSRGHGR